MQDNVGNLDRAVRMIVGAALVAFAVFGPADISWKGLGYIGFFVIVTGLIRTCPLYSVLGLSTCPRRAA